MYNENKIGHVKSDIKRTPDQVGESIEEMIRRCTESNEPIEASAPLIYTEEKEGVQAQYDIRTDRFELALDAIDKYQATVAAKAQEAPKEAPKEAPAEAPTGEPSAETNNA